MPGVNGPSDLQFLAEFRDIKNRLRALETQQQQTIVDGEGRPVMTTGLVPGSNPAQYGLQLLDPTTGNVVAFFGVDATGQVTNLTLGGNGSVIQSGDFDGALPSTAGTTGWALGGTGDSAIFNNLTLRGGIIGDAALANPAAFGVAYSDWDSVTFTATNLEKDTTITVPSGYTRALVTATATAGATASSTAAANLYASCSIQGTHPEFVAQQLAANFAGSVTRSYGASLTGLTGGGTISIGALGAVDVTGSVVSGSCNLHVTGSAIFLR